jgi:hypothetical protein
MRLQCSNLEALGDKGAEIVSLAIKDRDCKNNNSIHTQHTHTHTHAHTHTHIHTYTAHVHTPTHTRHTRIHVQAVLPARPCNRIQVKPCMWSRRTRASCVDSEEMPQLPRKHRPCLILVAPPFNPKVNQSLTPVPIHCLFTAYSLPIHCLFTAYSLPIHCLFTAAT